MQPIDPVVCLLYAFTQNAPVLDECLQYSSKSRPILLFAAKHMIRTYLGRGLYLNPTFQRLASIQCLLFLDLIFFRRRFPVWGLVELFHLYVCSKDLPDCTRGYTNDRDCGLEMFQGDLRVFWCLRIQPKMQ